MGTGERWRIGEGEGKSAKEGTASVWACGTLSGVGITARSILFLLITSNHPAPSLKLTNFPSLFSLPSLSHCTSGSCCTPLRKPSCLTDRMSRATRCP